MVLAAEFSEVVAFVVLDIQKSPSPDFDFDRLLTLPLNGVRW